MAISEMAKNFRLRLYQGCVGVVAGLCTVPVGFKGLCQCCAVVVQSCVGVVPGCALVLPGFCQGMGLVQRVLSGLCCGCAELCWGCAGLCHGFAWVLLGLCWGFSGFISFQHGFCLSLMLCWVFAYRFFLLGYM